VVETTICAAVNTPGVVTDALCIELASDNEKPVIVVALRAFTVIGPDDVMPLAPARTCVMIPCGTTSGFALHHDKSFVRT
jgi:hypothetical protein